MGIEDKTNESLPRRSLRVWVIEKCWWTRYCFHFLKLENCKHVSLVCFAGMETLRERERLFYTEKFHMIASYWSWHISLKAHFMGKIESSLKFGAARGENVGMQLETERLFVPKACSCTYLWCDEYNLIINLSVTENLLPFLKLVTTIYWLSKPWGLTWVGRINPVS